MDVSVFIAILARDQILQVLARTFFCVQRSTRTDVLCNADQAGSIRSISLFLARGGAIAEGAGDFFRQYSADVTDAASAAMSRIRENVARPTKSVMVRHRRLRDVRESTPAKTRNPKPLPRSLWAGRFDLSRCIDLPRTPTSGSSGG